MGGKKSANHLASRSINGEIVQKICKIISGAKESPVKKSKQERSTSEICAKNLQNHLGAKVEQSSYLESLGLMLWRQNDENLK